MFSELFHWSGILSIIACGLFQWQYARHNVSKKSYYTIKYFTKMAATVCDSIIFLFFGIALTNADMYEFWLQGSHSIQRVYETHPESSEVQAEVCDGS